MLRLKMMVALLVCLSAVGFAQSTTDSQAQGAPAQTTRVAAAEMAGLVEHKVLPQYPREALTKGIQGNVVFKIVVDETGKIVASEPLQGDPLLVGAGADALQDYRFRPYLINGSPVKVASELGFHFTLSRQGDSTNGEVECMSTIP
jgi:outer membrane biosynthesis protein TonB